MQRRPRIQAGDEGPCEREFAGGPVLDRLARREDACVQPARPQAQGLEPFGCARGELLSAALVEAEDRPSPAIRAGRAEGRVLVGVEVPLERGGRSFGLARAGEDAHAPREQGQAAERGSHVAPEILLAEVARCQAQTLGAPRSLRAGARAISHNTSPSREPSIQGWTLTRAKSPRQVIRAQYR